MTESLPDSSTVAPVPGLTHYGGPWESLSAGESELLVRLSREVEERDARAKIDGEEEEEGDVRAQEGGEEEDGEEEEEWENKADQDRADTGWMGCGHLGHALTTPRSDVSGQRPVLKTSGETTLVR
ncbi:uncharacterized protein LOC106013812 [Aplysia californica]|uniref:Uncharacterized protein LOC106013812 n=1 Tax=Aplysia californica TaxID=6500 RepID=A0ABM1AE52_APLCA|nr:uncharacterized protein LOC106013812 [Aplysia californica]